MAFKPAGWVHPDQSDLAIDLDMAEQYLKESGRLLAERIRATPVSDHEMLRFLHDVINLQLTAVIRIRSATRRTNHL